MQDDMAATVPPACFSTPISSQWSTWKQALRAMEEEDDDEDGEERSGGRASVHQTSCGATDVGSSVALESDDDEDAIIHFIKDAEAALLRDILAAALSRRPPPQTRRTPPAAVETPNASAVVSNCSRKKYYNTALEIFAAKGPQEVMSKQEPAPPPAADASVQTALAVCDSQRPALPEKAITAVPSQLSQSARLSELPLVDFVSHHSSSHDASVLITDKGTLVQPQPWMAFPTPLRPQLLPRRSSLSIDSDFRNQQRCLPLHNSPPSSPESRFRIIDTAPFMQPPPPRSSGSARESPRERRRVHFEFVSTLEDRRSTQELLVSTAKPALLEEDDVSFQSWVRVSPRSSADQQRALPLFDRSYATTTTLTSPTPVQRVPALPTRPVTIGTPNAAAGEGGRHGRQRHSRKSANATW